MTDLFMIIIILANIYLVCIVDIDGGELELPEELPNFPYEKEIDKQLSI